MQLFSEAAKALDLRRMQHKYPLCVCVVNNCCAVCGVQKIKEMPGRCRRRQRVKTRRRGAMIEECCQCHIKSGIFKTIENSNLKWKYAGQK